MREHLGQHFLTNKDILSRIAKLAGQTEASVIVEIGPGHGELTRELLAFPKKRLILVEKDEALAEALPRLFPDAFAEGRVRLETGDVRALLPDIASSLRGTPYVLAGNIPYYLTSFLFRMVGELPEKPLRAVFTIQKEVAERASAAPPRMNLLAASLQSWADVSIAFSIPRRDFSPPPRIDSATLLLEKKTDAVPPSAYFETLRWIFKQPRKTIGNNLRAFAEIRGIPGPRAAEILVACDINPADRPQTLSISALTRLSSMFYTEER